MNLQQAKLLTEFCIYYFLKKEKNPGYSYQIHIGYNTNGHYIQLENIIILSISFLTSIFPSYPTFSNKPKAAKYLPTSRTSGMGLIHLYETGK